MGFLLHILLFGMDKFLTPFDWLGPFWGLTLLSLLSGTFMLWVVGKTTPQKQVEASRNKMDSAVYEIRLFIDSPKRVAISLGRLMSHSVLYVVYMLPAFVILALPLGAMYLGLEARHGFEALPTNHPFVITVELDDGVDGSLLGVNPGKNLQITAPPLYVASEQVVYLRAEVDAPITTGLHLEVGRTGVDKLIVADPTATQMAPDRASGFDQALAYGPEAFLHGQITGIHVVHPARDNEYLGIGMPWWLWWLFWMMVAAFALKKRMGVAL